LTYNVKKQCVAPIIYRENAPFLSLRDIFPPQAVRLLTKYYRDILKQQKYTCFLGVIMLYKISNNNNIAYIFGGVYDTF
jgi:hypothetical protein